MAALAALLVITAAAPGSLACTKVWGGASSLSQLGLAVGPAAGVGTQYELTSSGTGISNFNRNPASSQVYCMAASDAPMTETQEPKSFAKWTVPLVVSVYGFFHGHQSKSPTVKMTPADTLNAYTVANYKWQSLLLSQRNGSNAGGLSGQVTAVARSGYSGTTFIIKNFWKRGAYQLVSPFSGDDFIHSSSPKFRPKVPSNTGNGIFYVDSGTKICSAAANANTIVYSQTGLCGSCTEIAIKTFAGTFIKSGSDTANFQPLFPSKFPSPTVPWLSGTSFIIPLDLALRGGVNVPPIAAVELLFVLPDYKKAANSDKAVKLLQYLAANLISLVPPKKGIAAFPKGSQGDLRLNIAAALVKA